MNHYIINPIYFYLANVSEGLGDALFTLGLVGLVIGATLTAYIMWAQGAYLDDINYINRYKGTFGSGEELVSRFEKIANKVDDIVKNFKSWANKFLVIGIILMSLGILVPSQKTCYQMMIASVATYENVDSAKNGIKDIVDYINNAADKMTESEEDN